MEFEIANIMSIYLTGFACLHKAKCMIIAQTWLNKYIYHILVLNMDRDKINRMFAVPHTFIADEARQAGAADSCKFH